VPFYTLPSLPSFPNIYVLQTLTATTTVPPGVLADKTKPAPGSVGLLWPSLEAKVVLDDGTEAAVGKAGELYVRGRSVALGYWQNEKATKETFLPGGWLRTGDQFRVDEWGNLLCVLLIPHHLDRDVHALSDTHDHFQLRRPGQGHPEGQF
jgi:acyl-CoA synthetase (AMP-forming)/AMP-acid ligase II